MSFSTGGGPHSARSDINVTPLVDVVLVLLIIFIVATPMLLRELRLEIPRKSEAAVDDTPDSQIVVEVNEEGIIKLGGQDVGKFDLATRVAELLKTKTDKVVFVGFADSLKYGEAVLIVDLIKGAGATKVALKMKDADKSGAPTGAPAPAPAGP